MCVCVCVCVCVELPSFTVGVGQFAQSVLALGLLARSRNARVSRDCDY